VAGHRRHLDPAVIGDLKQLKLYELKFYFYTHFNICIGLSDIHLLPDGTMLTALLRMLNTDVCGC
jgi:hypothetical protein